MVELERNSIKVPWHLIAEDISRFDEGFLLNTLHRCMEEAGFASHTLYLEEISGNKAERTRFLDSLPVYYSAFFRNPLSYTVLDKVIFPELIMAKNRAGKKEIRVWSAACAAGQEPYTLAILLEENIAPSNACLGYRIFATDKDPRQIDLAIRGIYTREALDNMSMKLTSRWFQQQGDFYHVKPRLKENIDFSIFDLTAMDSACPSASIYGDFDLVVCANLMFYYNTHFREIILMKAISALSAKGCLVTGEAERDYVASKTGLQEVYPRSCIFRKK